jgi:hypothetical protein
MEARPPSYDDIRRRLERHCAEAERLAVEAKRVEERLREARRERSVIERQLAEAALADPRTLAMAKQQAQLAYRQRVGGGAEPSAVLSGATAWLSELDRLNRAARKATGHAHGLTQRKRDADALVDRLVLDARAAQVAADSARQACLEARRALARHDEELVADAIKLDTSSVERVDEALTPIEAMLAGDRTVVASLVRRLAEESGLEPSRVELLLLELREGIVARAHEEAVLRFPGNHPFWSQFSRAEARAVAASLAMLGRGFDGQGGWQDDRVAEPRELAVALSLAGRDPRTLKHRPTRPELEALWQGVSVAAIEHVHESAPDLGLESITALLGPRAEGLADLWDNWGRLRRLLLSAAPPVRT